MPYEEVPCIGVPPFGWIMGNVHIDFLVLKPQSSADRILSEPEWPLVVNLEVEKVLLLQDLLIFQWLDA